MKNAKIVVLIILSATLITLSLFADDGAVEVAAGGVVFKELHGVTMESEVLKISPEKVEVTFRFRNNTDKDIETNVAFPVPLFGYSAGWNHHKIPDFHDFTVLVDGRAIKYDTEIKAIANEKECTDLLKKKGVPFQNIGHEGFCLEDYFKSSEVKKYVSLGIVEPYEWEGKTRYRPAWKVAIIYFWKQNFPAKKETIIRHTYSPVCGATQYWTNESVDYEWWMPSVGKYCTKDDIRKWIKSNYPSDCFLYPNWVSYILKTANTWDGPIKDFTLEIKKDPQEKVLLCNDLPSGETTLTKININVKNYTPTADLIVYYFEKDCINY